MAKTPTCPYCGGGMELVKYKQAWWYFCPTCHTESPAGGTPEAAMDKAMHLVSPWRDADIELPYSGTICVVHGHNKRGVDCYDIAMRGKTGWEFGSLTSFKVTHWMELPDAPKEVEHNADT